MKEEKEIPTAKEYCIDKLNISDEKEHEEASKVLIEFAKLHVKEALKQASEKAELDWFNGGCRECGSNEINRQSIINAYDLNNIK